MKVLLNIVLLPFQLLLGLVFVAVIWLIGYGEVS